MVVLVVSVVRVVDVVAGYRGRAVIGPVNTCFRGPGVVAVLGPNGCGKSTLLRCLAGVLKPFRGDVLLDNMSVYSYPDAKRFIGYMPADIGLAPRLTLYENLKLFAYLLGYDERFLREAIEAVKRFVQVDDILHVRAGSMSTGQRVRAGIVRAVIHNPRVVILDEPTRGLDPVHASSIRSLIRELGKQRLVIMSTHMIHEVFDLANFVAVLRRGKLVFADTIERFRDTLRDKPLAVTIRTVREVDDAIKRLGIEFEKREGNTYVLRISRAYEVSKVLREILLATDVTEVREDLDKLVESIYSGE